MRIAHFALDLGAGNECCNRIDNENIYGTTAHQDLGNFQGLFSGVRLGDQQVICVDPQFLGVVNVESMLGVDKSGYSACLLSLCSDMQGQGRFARGFRPINLDDSAARNATDSKGNIQAECSGRD